MSHNLPLPRTFIDTLPDPAGARRFMQQLSAAHPGVAAYVVQQPSLLANVLVLVAHSPFLAEAMLRRPEYIRWLGHERDVDRVKSKEELFQALARFAALHSSLSEMALLSRFKLREWLRIYLRDCLKQATLSETTLELSNLADVILQHALWHGRQELVNQYGTPEIKDPRGRVRPAEFAILAVGKLGSQELNYASDIDLVYLFSENGLTDTGQVTNKDFFIKLAERVTRVVGGVGEEGAVYRIDLRLRPHGRAGDIAVSLSEAIQYYRQVAQLWERQVLIRARSAAGDEPLVLRFLEAVRDDIYPQHPSPMLLEEIRAVKEKIDRETGSHDRGIHVKLGRGGIREIEFIAQALQLYFGGRDPWVRGGQILIGLQRLADKGILSDLERARLSDAYVFLRRVEHQLQIEHGLRSHTVRTDPERLTLLARRLGYPKDERPGAQFLADLQRHLAHVEAAFENLFRSPENGRAQPRVAPRTDQGWQQARFDVTVEQLAAALRVPVKYRQKLDTLISSALAKVFNPDRAGKNLTAFAESLTHAFAEETLRADVSPLPIKSTLATVEKLIRFFGMSQFFSQILISHPNLIGPLARTADILDMQTREDYLERLGRAVADQPDNLLSRMDALRRQWYEELLRIGYLDIGGVTSLRQTNLLQTALAEASLELACDLALQQLEKKYGPLRHQLRYVFLGLGRLGHSGMDYGSDLDLLVVYDNTEGSPLPPLSLKEVYTLFIEKVIHILSAMTREGYLYRVDLRLRPDGSDGPLARSRGAFLNYVRDRAAIWERLAYLKAYPIVGEETLARRVYRELQACLLQTPGSGPISLAREVRRIRSRIEQEKARGSARRNIKYGLGGMLDVYFATRYLQVKHQIQGPPERGTLPLINYLRSRGVLDETDHKVLYDGYTFLRRTDHSLRLLLDRSSDVVPANREQLQTLAGMLGYGSTDDWEMDYETNTSSIRATFERIVDSQA